MTQLWRRILFGVGLTCLIVAGLGATLMASLWLPWYAIPAGDIKIAWSNTAATRLPPALPVPPEVTHLATAAWRGVYMQPQGPLLHQATLLVLPKLAFQRATPAVLEAAGWQVRRVGPYILATHGTTGPSSRSPRAAFTALVDTLATSRWPWWPDVVVEAPDGFGTLREPRAAVITTAGTTWRVVVDRAIANPTLTTIVTSPGLLASPNKLMVAAPGSLWQNAPALAWDEVLYQGLRLTRTRPPITQTLASFPHSAVFQASGGDVAIVVDDANEQFALAATTWAQEEERRGRLVQRAFRLPDGTLGYEKVPGDAVPVFMTADEVGCRGPVANTTLWLCRRGDKTVIATSREHATAALAHKPTWPLMVMVTPAQFDMLQQRCPTTTGLGQLLCQLQSISWQGDEAYQQGMITWQD